MMSAFIRLLFLLVLFAVHECIATTLEDRIKRLGTDEDNIKRVQSLSSESAKAVELLIAELHAVNAVRVTANEQNPDTEHVLWVIRALRFLTGGKDFCAATTHKFGTTEIEKNRKYWLTFKGRQCLAFFATWPSRGSNYIAPHDSQLKIIGQWKQWYKSEGRSFNYKPLVNPEPKDWLW
jgi:hypothetical protein